VTAQLVVLVSGNGSNLQALISATAQDPANGGLDATITAVVSNRADAYALQRAQAAGIPTEIAPHQGIDRATYDQELAYTVASYQPDLVVLAGWDRILTTYFVAHHTTINLHPAKPGTFRGLGAIEKAFDAWQHDEITEGGVMVHYVPDEGVDDGPVLVWEPVPFFTGDTLDTYSERVHHTEHTVLIEAVRLALAQLPLTSRFGR